ncbi:nucleoside-triphosphatase [Lacinutrix jangbogonensis]|uniref:nucleoside-triphosphatase n=1 Tax=Lacinutrix jangbogonensis TaxID=1469557 RepID=UPI00053DD3B0|nr:nucleoside-triphosphatase [Lacinutrix jangbogonensis]
MIYILTGAIRTGKTTALLDWSSTRIDVDGLLCPDNEEGKRYFLKVKDKEVFELEVESNNEEVIEIGSFKFLKSAFKKAHEFLILIALETKDQYLIIDEIGKLELKNEGLHLSSEKLIPKHMHNANQHLILVVRDYLLEDVLKHYAISEYKIINKEALKRII